MIEVTAMFERHGHTNIFPDKTDRDMLPRSLAEIATGEDQYPSQRYRANRVPRIANQAPDGSNQELRQSAATSSMELQDRRIRL